jgi:hypothetical protein
MMPYTHVNNFRDKGTQSFSKKVWKPLNFMEKWVKKIIVDDFFVVIFNSKLSHFDKNINFNFNLNHKYLSPNWRKQTWSLIYGEHSELARQI